MLVDTHIHVGQFNDLYIPPSYISKLMSDVGVDYFSVSSTSICEENYPKVLDEIQTLIEMDGDKVFPVMWITPEGLNGNIAWFLESNIKWECLKVHPFLHKNDWIPNGTRFKEVIAIARELALPLLIHTGFEDSCQSGIYEPMIAENQDVEFILAHGRPIEQAIKLAKKYDNVYADSAFMPISDMERFISVGLSHKLLWGTDMCIPIHFFPQEDMVNYYSNKLNAFKKVCTLEQFDQVTFKNAAKLFVSLNNR